MDGARLIRVLLYCMGINYTVLILWFVAFLAARSWLYRLHTTWFRLSPEGFDALNYGGMAIYKIGILLLNVAPLIAIYFSTGPSSTQRFTIRDEVVDLLSTEATSPRRR